MQNKRTVRIEKESNCLSVVGQLAAKEVLSQLDGIYPLYHRGCFSEVIALGQKLRDENRDKVYSLSRESAEVIVNEGQVKPYVLESFERTHLSYMIALSYLKIGKREEAKVELRRAIQEMNAQIYNSGTDELNLFFIGNLWESLGKKEEALPAYRRIVGMVLPESTWRQIAEDRIRILENPKKSKSPSLHIYAIGNFPNIIYWGSKEFQESYPNGYSLKNCSSQSGVLLNIAPWSAQVAARGQDKDEVSTYKRWARSPATLLYTAGVLLAGGAIFYAAQPYIDSGELGFYWALGTLFVASRTFTTGTGPDMRYWSELPSAYIFTEKSDIQSEPCAFQHLERNGLTPIQIL
jgi:tetratricopeptide (TPR) repeat protein